MADRLDLCPEACDEVTVGDGGQLVIPVNDVVDPELSIVIPALNEELTIAHFIDWCLEGIAAGDIAAEILIIDSSTDRTAEIAVAKGARVLKVPRRGLGRAYIDALPYIRGKYVLLGDSDCTYDFRVLQPWVAGFRQGYEFIMGSRFRGVMEEDAMPKLHRYFGTPLMTVALNLLYGTKFSDIHCGMRGITLDGFKRMHLRSNSWEYASEMIVKSRHLRLRTNEIPIDFLRDQIGRVSHHKRLGWHSPWVAGWINLREILTYCADVFAFMPGLFATIAGLIPVFLSFIIPGDPVIEIDFLLAGAFTVITGMGLLFVGAVARLLYDFTGILSRRWSRLFSYNRVVLTSLFSMITGIALLFLAHPHQLLTPAPSAAYLHALRLFVLGCVLVVFSFYSFVAALVLHAAALIRFKPTD